AEQVEDALSSGFGSRWISTIYAPSNQYRVIVELEPRYQKDPAILSMLYVRASNGKLIPLNTVAKVSMSVAPLLVNHLGQLPAATISFNLKPGASLGEAVEKVEKYAKDVLPGSVTYKFQGTAQAFQASFADMWFLLLIAVFVIYLVLGVLYESFVHPLTILTGLPPAGLGALITLMIFHCELNIYSFLGLILLIGIVKKNAIMMIDFALDAQRKHNQDPASAIYEACLIRFRPIMMTTMAALMGSLPLAFGYGAGGESRQPLGLAVVGGLIVSQMLTLYITPVFYLFFDSLQNKLRRNKPSPDSGIPAIEQIDSATAAR
ncbi:MAG: efflux RND transporter permease subunit, partial [Terriglobales bacterium]